MAESLEPVAGWKELAGIPSSEIQVLFFLMLGSCLWVENARSYQYITAFIHSFTLQVFIIELLLYTEIIDSGDTRVKKIKPEQSPCSHLNGRNRQPKISG